MRPAFVAALLVVVGAACAAASGWNDYELEIAPGFSVYRSNAFDVCLGTSDGHLLICPSDFPGKVGPLEAYAVTPTAILTRHQAIRSNPRNPAMPAGNPSKHWFFVVSRSTQQVVGPLSPAEFEQQASRLHLKFVWKTASNPNFWLPLLGGLMFLGYTAVFVAWPVLLVVAAGGGWWWWRRRLRSKRAVQRSLQLTGALGIAQASPTLLFDSPAAELGR